MTEAHLRRVDRILGGDIRIEALIGSGGMGSVYRGSTARAVHGLEPGHPVAVKLVHAHLGATPGFRERFRQEAEVGRRVVHPNVVRTYAADGADLDREPVEYLVMEYVEGQTLREIGEELPQAPEDLARHVGREIARGLAAIHASGVVHRDLKPANVIVTPDQTVKIMDLGAVLELDAAVRLSLTGQFVGTLLYAAPEQITGERGAVDGRADLYALGLVLYELVTGEHPFEDPDVRTVLRRQLRDEVSPAAERNPQISPFFEELLSALLAKVAEDRPASAEALLEVLEEGEASAWWQRRARAIRSATRRPLRRIRIPRETALYGRAGDLDRLHAAWEAARRGEGRVVLVEGEAGIGKTRLVDELVSRIEGEGEAPHVLHGTVPPGGAATATGAFAQAYREHFGNEGLETSLTPYLSVTPGLVPAFAALLRGLPAPPDAATLDREAMQSVFVHATRALAREQPTIVSIDDLHFAPDEARALFAALAMAVPGHRILLVGTARPGLPEDWTAALSRHEFVARLPLARLAAEDVVRLLADAFRSDRLAEELAPKVLQKSSGNPFFLFEIVKSLRERGVLARKSDGGLDVTRIVDQLEIPSSILDLVQARLAELDPEDRSMLDAAACDGYEFDPGLLAEALERGRIPLLQALGRVERKHGLVRSAGPRFVFDHHQVHEALVLAIPPALREAYHAALGAALAARIGEDVAPEQVEGALALRLCRHLMAGALGDRAVRWLAPALSHLEAGHEHAAAEALSARFLDADGLLDEDRTRLSILLRRAHHLGVLGRSKEEAAVLGQASAVAERLGDPVEMARVDSQRGWRLLHDGNLEEAREVLESALERASAADALEVEITTRGYLAGTLTSLRRPEDARRRLEENLRLAREHGIRKFEASAIGGLGNLHWSEGRHDEARKCDEEALRISREIGDLHRASIATGNLGTTYSALGDYDRSLFHQRERLRIAREIGHRRGEAVATGNLSRLLAALGRSDESRELAERQQSLCREVGHALGEILALSALGEAASQASDEEEAERCFRECVARAREVGNSPSLATALRGLGVFYVDARRPEEAVPVLDEAIEVAREAKSTADLILSTGHRASLPDGDIAAFVALAEENRADLRRQTSLEMHHLLWRATGDPAHLEEAREVLAFLRAHAPEEDRDRMIERVPLYRAVSEGSR